MNDTSFKDEFDEDIKRAKRNRILFIFIIVTILIIAAISLALLPNENNKDKQINGVITTEVDAVSSNINQAKQPEEASPTTSTINSATSPNDDKALIDQMNAKIRNESIDNYDKKYLACTKIMASVMTTINKRLYSNESIYDYEVTKLSSQISEGDKNCAFMDTKLAGVSSINEQDLNYIKEEAFNGWVNLTSAVSYSGLGSTSYYNKDSLSPEQKNEAQNELNKAKNYITNFTNKYNTLNISQYR